MTAFVFTDPSGNQYDVEAPNAETAAKEFAKFRQSQANEKLVTEANTAPEWAKPFMAARDVATVAPDTLTGGWSTKALKAIFGGEPEMNVEARRNRMGWAAPALDVGLMAGALPTAVPKVIGMMGGGPAARAIVGTGAAAAEGGLVGGVSAAGHDKDVAAGAALGGAGGAIGQQLGGLLNRGYNALRGIDNSVPQGIRSKLTVLPPNASAADKVTVAANQAASKARLSDDPLKWQENTKGAIESLLRKEPKTFTPKQRGLMEEVVTDDPATKLSRVLGKTLTDKMAVGGAGMAGVLAHPLIGAATVGGMLGGGRALKGVSAGGTREAMDDLLREMRGKTKVEGPLSPAQIAKMRLLMQQGALELTPDDL